MKSSPWLVLAAVLLAGLSACDPAGRVSDRDIVPIEYPQLVKLLNDPEARVVLLDVRRAADFDKGHLPGAVNVFLPDLNRADRHLTRAKTIVVYASGEPQDPLAPAAAKELIRQGYNGVREFRGGMVKWTAEGGEIVSPATVE